MFSRVVWTAKPLDKSPTFSSDLIVFAERYTLPHGTALADAEGTFVSHSLNYSTNKSRNKLGIATHKHQYCDPKYQLGTHVIDKLAGLISRKYLGRIVQLGGRVGSHGLKEAWKSLEILLEQPS